MPQYLLLLYADPTGWRTMPLADAQKWMGKYLAWDDKARQAGFYAGGNKLNDQPPEAARTFIKTSLSAAIGFSISSHLRTSGGP